MLGFSMLLNASPMDFKRTGKKSGTKQRQHSIKAVRQIVLKYNATNPTGDGVGGWVKK